MPFALTLIDDIRWRGDPVVGERPRALIGALVDAGPAGRSSDALIDDVWGDEPPANPTKALQVQVSRVRSATDHRLIERSATGYRLGLARDEVDVLTHADLRAAARAAYESGQLDKALVTAQRALEIGPADDLRTLVALARSRGGDHAAALPVLEELAAANPADEDVLACLLHSEAAVRGPAAALERYEQYRAALADRLGTDPGPAIQDVYRELLAADRPVRDGVLYDGTTLLGRDGDIRALRALIASSRVVSIVGAGGLGKTRLAHVLGRDAEQPVVHFVELVGVTAPEDVVGEVGSVLGVRDSVIARQSLTPEQRADVRSRIAQHLAAAPSLLILDNCEHLVDAVADLVAFLVAATRNVHVVTTTRAPLNIAAERVYALSELQRGDASELFRERAVAARPNVVLDAETVTEIVIRLDGLPLAIELAAAKVRVMSVEDIARRLENRFALLRGGDRTAPDRHQTLLAVIDWSWNLLDEPERRALRWLSLFHDGFTYEAAEAVLGPAAMDSVESLVEQSLLSVHDSGHSVRYRMLETVREFGRMQLIDAGEDAEASRAQRAWMRAYADRYFDLLWGSEQVAAMDALRAEEGNLADLLRQALAEPDPETVVVLFSTAASFWSIVGEHGRIIALLEALEEALDDWTPPDELVDQARVALSVALTNAAIAVPSAHKIARDLLARLGSDSERPAVRAICKVTLAFDPADPDETVKRMEELSESPEGFVAMQALQYHSHFLENDGHAVESVAAAKRALALWRPDDGPWIGAILRTFLAQMLSQLGEYDAAAEYARAAIPVLDRLESIDDAIQSRAVLACQAMLQGRLDDAEQLFVEIEELDEHRPGFGSGAILAMGRAELLLLRGDIEDGLAAYNAGIERVQAVRLPILGEEFEGLEPWILAAEASALAAYALHGTGDDGRDLWRRMLAKAGRAARPSRRHLDYPVLGVVFFGLGMWALHRKALPPQDAVRLCVLAERFGYSRRVPTLSWDNAVAAAERFAPGMLDELADEYGDRRGRELLTDARDLITRLTPEPR
ncbi:ATP-binding protein [Solicola gregarius]|uniref:NB-ARC domain-containing protein n=1 Tax=Solicola gregarius TaxID=2908642 RepID=A0AA46TGH3_9ACTN|nr:BTAD domain-containing putative transcriptional regulator [Solicola gregarius]UYM04686.1 NB-ARC domain-containing protein [Solicola gregarius]